MRAGLAVLAVAACGEDAPAAREPDAGAGTPLVLMLVEDLDEEGGLISRTFGPDTVLAAYRRHGAVFADARVVAHYLGVGSRIDVAGGTLRLDGTDTGIAAERRDSASYVALRPLADGFRAYARVEESPGRMVTLWRHDILCRYAHGADRRAEVFLAAAEQGLLRHCEPAIEAHVRRWTDARPGELWAASITLTQAFDSADTAEILDEYRAAPYSAYGVAAGHHVIVRVAPDSASLQTIGLLGAAAVDALERALCGLPDALDRRRHMTVRRSGAPGEDRFHGERHMLASALAARRELPRVRAGTAMIHGVDVVASAADLRRLAADTRVRIFEPATRLDTMWVVPGADTGAAPGISIPAPIARLDSAALFDRLDAEAALAAAECAGHGR